MHVTQKLLPETLTTMVGNSTQTTITANVILQHTPVQTIVIITSIL